MIFAFLKANLTLVVTVAAGISTLIPKSWASKSPTLKVIIGLIELFALNFGHAKSVDRTKEAEAVKREAQKDKYIAEMAKLGEQDALKLLNAYDPLNKRI